MGVLGAVSKGASMIFPGESFDAKEGQYSLPNKPGLGIDIDEGKLEKYKIEPSL